MRVDGYLSKVRELPYNTRDIARTYPGVHERSSVASNLTRNDVKIAVVTIDHNGGANDELFDSVEALSPILDAMIDEAASGLSQKCKFFVVQDLSVDVVKTFGGYLDIDPEFFIDHVEGGETVPINYDCHLVSSSFIDGNKCALRICLCYRLMHLRISTTILRGIDIRGRDRVEWTIVLDRSARLRNRYQSGPGSAWPSPTVDFRMVSSLICATGGRQLASCSKEARICRKYVPRYSDRSRRLEPEMDSKHLFRRGFQYTFRTSGLLVRSSVVSMDSGVTGSIIFDRTGLCNDWAVLAEPCAGLIAS